MEKKEPLLASIVSIVLHPFLMISYGVALLFLYTDFYYLFGHQFFRFMAPVILFSCLLPLVSIYFLVRAGVVKDYDLKDKNDRFYPLLISLVSHAFLFYFFLKTGIYVWFLCMLAAPLVMLAVTFVITIFWKISAHMLAIGGLIGGVLSVCYNVKGLNPYLLFVILFILAGCLGVSRLVLKRHTPAQVYAGFLVGLVISYACVWIGANFVFILKFIN